MSVQVSHSTSSASFCYREERCYLTDFCQPHMGASGAKPLSAGSPNHPESADNADDCFSTESWSSVRSSSPAAQPNACNCPSCKEKDLVVREMEAEQQEEARLLHTDWVDLRQSLKQFYWLYLEPPAADSRTAAAADALEALVRDKVLRLCQRDPHQLFHRLQGQVQEVAQQVRQRLLQLLTQQPPALPQHFITQLLDTYDNMLAASAALTPTLHPLELQHLSRFGVCWDTLNKHAYQSVVYMDPMVQNNLPTFISQLRALLAGDGGQRHHSELVHRYLAFDQQMCGAARDWASAERRLQEYSQEQATLKAKQRLLREDWELLRAQRKLLHHQVLGRDQTAPSELANGFTCHAETSSGQPDGDQLGWSDCSGEPGQSDQGPGSDHQKCNRQPDRGPDSSHVKCSRRPDGSPESGHQNCSRQRDSSPESVQKASSQPDLCSETLPHSQTSLPPSAESTAGHQTGRRAVGSQTSSVGIQHGCSATAKQEAATDGTQTERAERRSSCPAPGKSCSQPAARRSAPPDAEDTCSGASQDSSSETSSQHCRCCYCEVFGHGVPPVVPVSRNYPEIRDRLRLRLNQRRRDKSQSSTEHGGDGWKPAEDDRDLTDLLQYIEADDRQQKRNHKRAVKRERQRQRREQELRHQDQLRSIQEFQRRNPDVTITMVNSAPGAQEGRLSQANVARAGRQRPTSGGASERLSGADSYAQPSATGSKAYASVQVVSAGGREEKQHPASTQGRQLATASTVRQPSGVAASNGRQPSGSTASNGRQPSSAVAPNGRQPSGATNSNGCQPSGATAPSARHPPDTAASSGRQSSRVTASNGRQLPGAPLSIGRQLSGANGPNGRQPSAAAGPSGRQPSGAAAPSNRQSSAAAVSAGGGDASAAASSKSTPLLERLSRSGLLPPSGAEWQPTATGDSRMVTIRRVMEPGGSEPKVTITLKGDSPEKDCVLMTLVNGQMRADQQQQKQTQQQQPLTKTAKKKMKKAAKLLKQQEEEERARREAEEAARREAEEAARREAEEAAKRQAEEAARQQKGKKKNKKKKKKAACAEDAGVRVVSAPEPAASTGRLSPPTQLMQDLALSSSCSSCTCSDSEVEDLARTYRIPAGITISRVRCSGPGCHRRQQQQQQHQSQQLQQPLDTEKRTKKRRKKKQQVQPADGEILVTPDVTIRKLEGGAAAAAAAAAYSGEQRRRGGSVDDYESVFMPATAGDKITDLVDKEVEAFKRFCLDGPQVSREHRPKVNLNIKDILIKKKPL